MIAILALILLQSPTVDDIMLRVGENQGRSLDARKQWVFEQDMLVRLHRSNGKLAREESRKYTVTPSESGFARKIEQFEGKYEAKGKFISYTEPDFKYKGLDIDGDVVHSFSEDFMADHSQKNGTDDEMFPLTTHEQQKYNYKLEGREDYRGTPVYRISFSPKPKTEDADWKGEALIDVEEFEPLMVTTSLGWGIPAAVKVLLGTDIHHVGFKITYKKVEPGVWFPATYGGEFFLKVGFFYKRDISISIKNDTFKKTDVASKVTFETP